MFNVVGDLVAQDSFHMSLALEQAARALADDEVPVGAVVICDNEVVGQGYNCREKLQEPTGHAEIVAMRAAASRLKSWRLENCALYVTLEPCIMCMGAIIQARLPRLVFGCLDPKGGAVVSLYRLGDDPRLNHQLEMRGGVMEAECADILSMFFNGLRQKKKADA